MATTLYVGSDQTYKTIQEAIQYASDTEDTTIILSAGTYAGADITLSEVGKQKGNITIQAADAAEVIVNGTIQIGYYERGVSNEDWNGKVTFSGITFDHAENEKHSINVGAACGGVVIENCKIIGDGEYGIGSAGGNNAGKSTIVNTVFTNAAMQVLGNFGTGLVIDNCTFDESRVNVQGGNSVTIKNSTFDCTVTDACNRDSFYCVRSNDTPITIENTKFEIDSTVAENDTVPGSKGWGVLVQRGVGNTKWNATDIEVNFTNAAQNLDGLYLNRNDTTNAANEDNRITINNLTSTSNNIDNLVQKSTGSVIVKEVDKSGDIISTSTYKDGNLLSKEVSILYLNGESYTEDMNYKAIKAASGNSVITNADINVKGLFVGNNAITGTVDDNVGAASKLTLSGVNANVTGGEGTNSGLWVGKDTGVANKGKYQLILKNGTEITGPGSTNVTTPGCVTGASVRNDGYLEISEGSMVKAQYMPIKGGVKITGENSVLDIQGATVFGDNANITIENGGKLQLIGIDRNLYPGLKIGNGEDKAVVNINKNGTLLIDGAADGSHGTMTIEKNGVVKVNGGALILTDGAALTNKGTLTVNGGTFTADSFKQNSSEQAIFTNAVIDVTNFSTGASGQDQYPVIGGTTLVNIDNLTGYYALRVADGIVFKDGTSIKTVNDPAASLASVRALGSVTFGEKSTDVVHLDSFDNKGIEWSSDSTITINGTLSISEDGKAYGAYWFGIYGGKLGTGAVTTLTGTGTANINTTAIFQLGTVLIDKDLTINMTNVKDTHLRFTEADVTIKGKFNKEGYGDVKNLITNSTVTVTGENASLNIADDFRVGYDLNNSGVLIDENSTKQNSVLNVKNGAEVIVGNNAYVNVGNSININNSTFTAKTLENKGTVNISGASTLNGGVDAEGAVKAVKVTGSGNMYLTGAELDANTAITGNTAYIKAVSGTNTITDSKLEVKAFHVGDKSESSYLDKKNGSNITLDGSAVLHVKGNDSDESFGGWIGTRWREKSEYGDFAKTNTARYKLMVTDNAVATFDYLHVAADGELYVNSKGVYKPEADSDSYAFYANRLIANGVVEFKDTTARLLSVNVSNDNPMSGKSAGKLSFIGSTAKVMGYDGIPTDVNIRNYGVLNISGLKENKTVTRSSVSVWGDMTVEQNATVNISNSTLTLKETKYNDLDKEGKLDNAGTINITNGTLTATSLVNNGTFTVKGETIININKFNNDSKKAIIFENVTITADSQIGGNFGRVFANKDFTVKENVSFSLKQINIYGNALIENGATFTAPTSIVDDYLKIEDNATLNVKYFNVDGTADIEGTVNVTNDNRNNYSTLVRDGGTVNVASTGSIIIDTYNGEIKKGGTLNLNGGSIEVTKNTDGRAGKFKNAGTFNINGGIVDVAILENENNMNISNNATITVTDSITNSGTITISGNSTINATITGNAADVASGATLNGDITADLKLKGNITLNGTYTGSITGNKNITVAGGTLNLRADSVVNTITIGGSSRNGVTLSSEIQNLTIKGDFNTVLLNDGGAIKTITIDGNVTHKSLFNGLSFLDSFGEAAISGKNNAELTVNSAIFNGNTVKGVKLNLTGVKTTADVDINADVALSDIKSINENAVSSINGVYFYGADEKTYILNKVDGGIDIVEAVAGSEDADVFEEEMGNFTLTGDLADFDVTMKSGKTTLKVANGDSAAIGSIEKSSNGGVNNVSVGNGSGLIVGDIERMGNITVGKNGSEMTVTEELTGTSAAETIAIGDNSDFESKGIDFTTGKATFKLGKNADATVDGDFTVNGANNTITLAADAGMNITGNIINNCGDNYDYANGKVLYAPAFGTTINLGKGAVMIVGQVDDATDTVTTTDVIGLAGLTLASGSAAKFDKNNNEIAEEVNTIFAAGDVYGTEKNNTINVGNFGIFTADSIDMFDGNDTIKIGSDSEFVVATFDQQGNKDHADIVNVETINIGARSAFAAEDIIGVNKLTAANGDKKAEIYTILGTEGFIEGTAKNDTISLGNWNSAVINGGIDLLDGNDTIKIGSDSILFAGNDPQGAGNMVLADIANVETISIGARSKLVAKDITGVNKLTAANGVKYDTTQILATGEVTGTAQNDTISLGNWSAAHFGKIDLGAGNNTIKIGNDSYLYAGAIYIGDYTSASTLSIGANVNFTASSLVWVNKLTVGNGTTFAIGSIAGSGKNDTITFGNNNTVTATSISLQEGNDTIMIGNDSTVTVSNLVSSYNIGSIYGAETINIGSRSSLIAGTISGGLKKLTAANGSYDKKTGTTSWTELEADSMYTGNENDSITFGNYNDVDIADLSLNDGNDTLKIGNDSVADFGKVDLGSGNDIFNIGDRTTVTATKTIKLGNDNDTFKIGNDSTVIVEGSLNFGSGKDTMTIGKNSVVKFESINMYGGDDTINASNGAELWFNNGADDVDLTGVAGSWKNATIFDDMGNIVAGSTSGSVYANEWDVFEVDATIDHIKVNDKATEVWYSVDGGISWNEYPWETGVAGEVDLIKVGVDFSDKNQYTKKDYTIDITLA